MYVCVRGVNNIMLILGLADTLKATFPPFPLPAFMPNFTGYDLDKQDINWYDTYEKATADEKPAYVRITVSYRWQYLVA